MAWEGRIRRSAEEAEDLLSQATRTGAVVIRALRWYRIRGCPRGPSIDGTVQLPREVKQRAPSSTTLLLRGRHCTRREG